MRKIIAGVLVLVLLVAGCAKKITAGGTWTFLGNTYNATTCIGVGNYVAASNSTNTNVNTFGGITVFFAGTKLPTTSGTYAVVDTTPAQNQVNVVATVGGAVDTAYTAIGNGQTVSVNVSNGKVSVSGSGILLQNTTISPATFPVTFSISNN
jgi:hypothetical protein